MAEHNNVLEGPVEQIVYQLSEDEFAQGYEHFLRQNKKAYLGLGIMAFMFLVFMNTQLFSPRSSDFTDYLQFNIAVILAAGIGLYLLRKLALYNTKKNLRASPFYNANLAAIWNTEALAIQSETGFQRYDWPKFRMWTEDDIIFTLFFGPHLFITLPKRVFTGDQQASLKAHLEKANIPLAKLMPF